MKKETQYLSRFRVSFLGGGVSREYQLSLIFQEVCVLSEKQISLFWIDIRLVVVHIFHKKNRRIVE